MLFERAPSTQPSASAAARGPSFLAPHSAVSESTSPLVEAMPARSAPARNRFCTRTPTPTRQLSQMPILSREHHRSGMTTTASRWPCKCGYEAHRKAGGKQLALHLLLELFARALHSKAAGRIVHEALRHPGRPSVSARQAHLDVGARRRGPASHVVAGREHLLHHRLRPSR